MSRCVWLRSSTSVSRVRPMSFVPALVASAGWKHNASFFYRRRTDLLVILGVHVCHLVSSSNKGRLACCLLCEVLLQLLNRTLNSHCLGPILRLFRVQCRLVPVGTLRQCGDSASRRLSIAQSLRRLKVFVYSMRINVLFHNKTCRLIPAFSLTPSPPTRPISPLPQPQRTCICTQ
jgi:hypothetical protein